MLAICTGTQTRVLGNSLRNNDQLPLCRCGHDTFTISPSLMHSMLTNSEQQATIALRMPCRIIDNPRVPTFRRDFGPSVCHFGIRSFEVAHDAKIRSCLGLREQGIGFQTAQHFGAMANKPILPQRRNATEGAGRPIGAIAPMQQAPMRCKMP